MSCHNCGKKAAFVCGCASAFYCGKKCQIKHFEIHSRHHEQQFLVETKRRPGDIPGYHQPQRKKQKQEKGLDIKIGQSKSSELVDGIFIEWDPPPPTPSVFYSYLYPPKESTVINQTHTSDVVKKIISKLTMEKMCHT